MKRLLLALTMLSGLSACATGGMDADPPEMGNFLLGHVAVVVDEPEIGPFSREATDDEMRLALEKAIEERFRPYDGDKYFHIGVKLDLYALALPGVPLVFTPKSVFVASVNIWDDATQSLLTPEGGKDLTVFESLSGETVISSGLTQTKEEQLANLAENTAKAIQDYILDNPEWVGLPPLPAEDDGSN